MTDKEKLKSYYKYKPPLRFIKNKFFCAECEDLYEDKIQILCLQYALQLLWVAEVVWIEDMRLSRSRVQDLIIDELTAQDLIKVVQQYKLIYKNPWEQALVILVVLINRLLFPDREENKYEVMRIKNASPSPSQASTTKPIAIKSSRITSTLTLQEISFLCRNLFLISICVPKKSRSTHI